MCEIRKTLPKVLERLFLVGAAVSSESGQQCKFPKVPEGSGCAGDLSYQALCVLRDRGCVLLDSTLVDSHSVILTESGLSDIVVARYEGRGEPGRVFKSTTCRFVRSSGWAPNRGHRSNLYVGHVFVLV